jgi:hypothetical protein
MRSAPASLLVVLSAFGASPLLAHEGGHDVRGTVISVGADELTVKTSHGEEKFALTSETEFVQEGTPATAKDLRPADRAVVHSRKKSGRMEAVKVEFRRSATSRP